MADERSVRVRVTGRVQGVGFRYATERAAQAIGVHGFVRNLPDRSVEAVFEGVEKAVEQALSFVRAGPPGARVERIEIEDITSQHHESFEVRY